MSGFLRRLVQRTLRADPEIRSTARLPFAPPSNRDTREPILEDRSLEDVSLEDISKEQAAPREIMRQAPPNPVVESNQVGDLPGSPDKLIFEPDRPQSPDYSKTTADRHSRAVVQAVSEPERSERLSQGQPRSVLKQTEAPDSSSPAPHVREIDADFEPLVNTAARIDEVVESNPVAWAADKTAPEYVLSDAPPRKSAARVRSQPMRYLDTKVTETNEVHVTIGRIEITAVHAPQPTKPPPSPAKKPVSLDEYLAKRNGSGP